MINLNKLMKLVKSGGCYFNAFRHKVKIADDFGEENDPAAKWLAEQREQQAGQGHISPTTPVSQPPQQVGQQVGQQAVPSDIEVVMDTLIKSNREELEFESRNTLPILMKKKDFLLKGDENLTEVEKMEKEQMGESYLPPAPEISKALIQNPDLHSVFVNKIKNLIADEAKANVFVDTMVAKAQNLMGAINAREEEMKREEEAGLLQQEQQLERKKKDPYAFAVELPNPKLDILAQERFMGLSDVERQNIEEAVPHGYSRQQLANATSYKLSAPEQGQLDQRMNFFLRFPQYLQSVIDPKFESILREELPKMGIPVEQDVLSAVGRASSAKGVKNRLCRILNNEKGAELHNILSGLIQNADPIIAKWFGDALLKGEKEDSISYHAPIGTDDKTPAQNLAGQTSAEAGEYQVNWADKKESSETFGVIMEGYLAPILKKSDHVKREVLGDMSDDTAQRHRGAETAAEKKDIMKSYAISEQLNAFTSPLLDHVGRLLGAKGEAIKADPRTMIYKNNEGKFHLPKDVLNDVYKEDRNEHGDVINKIDRFDHPALVKRYQDRVESGKIKKFVPQWDKMVSYQFPVQSYKKLGDLKAKVKDLAKQPENAGAIKAGNFDIIKRHFPSSPEEREALYKLFGLDEFSPPEIGEKKLDDFIYMTLNQNDEYVKWLQKLGPKRGGKFKGLNKNVHHELKEDIGSNFHHILGYLSNRKDQESKRLEDVFSKMMTGEIEMTPELAKRINNSENYSDEAISSLLSLMDFHPNVRQFMRAGRMPNPQDPQHRTNTELYYNLKGEEPPEHIKELFNVYNEGINESSTSFYKGQKSFVPGSWYGLFFKTYDQFDRLMNAKTKKQNNIDDIKIEKEEYYEYINNKAFKIVNDEKKYNKLLLSMPDVNKRIEFDSKIQEWAQSAGAVNLPSEMYAALGQAATLKRLKKFDEVEKKLRDGYTSGQGKTVIGIKDIDEEMAVLKGTLSDILEKNNYVPKDPSALRLANEAYKRALIKIAALERMKKLNIKVASINYVDLEIARVKAEFDRYFNSLFL